jgi:hypothetical protein
LPDFEELLKIQILPEIQFQMAKYSTNFAMTTEAFYSLE